MPQEPAVQVHQLSKVYRIYASPWARLVSGLTRRQWGPHRQVDSLRDVSFSVEPGQGLGIIGRNGAGKSTLLKILAGTTTPSRGAFRCAEPRGSLIEIGTGFHPALSGRENVRLSASIGGLSRQTLRSLEKDIIDFTELGTQIDRPLRTYSSGMMMRLGFALAVATRPAVLLIDEVIGVGDMHFQKKCLERIDSLRSEGTALLFCTHSMAVLAQFCERTVWLEDGAVQGLGDTDDILRAYSDRERRRDLQDAQLVGRSDGASVGAPVPEGEDQTPRLVDVDLEDPRSGESIRRLHSGDPVRLRLDYHVRSEVAQLHVGAAFYRPDNVPAFTMGTEWSEVAVPARAGTLYRAHIDIPSLRLLHGELHVQGYLYDENALHVYDSRLVPGPLRVEPRVHEPGSFVPDHRWGFERLET